MKIKFKGLVDFSSKGISFTPGATYEVSKEVYEYLKGTFDNVELLEEPKEVKPVEESKAKPKGAK